MATITLRTPAKINLGLEILRRRPDGYHDIQSIFLGIDLYDELTAEPWSEPVCECYPLVTERPDDNLVMKAMHAYRSAVNSNAQAAKITLRKRIPSGAGLGGGSSDAAATLRILNEINQLATDSQLLTMASSLGSDVPFFLHPTWALVSGRGEIVEPLEVSSSFAVLLVNPGVHINTAWAYSTLGITGEYPQSDLVNNLHKCLINKDDWSKYFNNHFETSIFAAHPSLAVVKQELIRQGAFYASLSGSGSTMYGLYTSVDNARIASSAFADMDTYICQPLTATPGMIKSPL